MFLKVFVINIYICIHLMDDNVCEDQDYINDNNILKRSTLLLQENPIARATGTGSKR